MFGYKFIPEEKFKGFEYKYSGLDNSLLVKFILKRFWEWLVLFFPMWFAPNLITFIGFLCLFSNFILSLYFCPTICGCAIFPSWAYYLFALNIFIYQTMDNLDGKQARRTDNSSALGELFDHGCDSLFLFFTMMPVGNMMNLDPLGVYVIMVIGSAVFYCAHWEEYFSKKLVLGYFANPTEIQWFFIIIFIFTTFTGNEWWIEIEEFNGFLFKRNNWTIILFTGVITLVILDKYKKITFCILKFRVPGLHINILRKVEEKILENFLNPLFLLLLLQS